MNIGGIVAGAMEGGAQAAGSIAQGHIDDKRKAGLAQIEADIAAKRQQALETWRAQQADKARTDRAADIGKRAQGIIDTQRRDAVTAAGTSEARRDAATSAPVSDDQRAAARERAMQEGGYIEPKDEVAGNRRTAALEAKVSSQRDALDFRAREGTANRDLKASEGEANREVRREVAAARVAHIKTQTPERLTTQLNSIKELRKMHAETSSGRSPEAKAAWQQKLEDYDEQIDEIVGALRERRNGGAEPAKPAAPAEATPKPKDGETPKPKAAAPSGVAAPKSKAEYDALPKGARYTKPGETAVRVKQ
jgi:hypothetical protein